MKKRIQMSRALMYYGSRMPLNRSILGWVSRDFGIAFRRIGQRWAVYGCPSYGKPPLATGATLKAAAEAWHDAGMPA